jgi:hypothetical protein
MAFGKVKIIENKTVSFSVRDAAVVAGAYEFLHENAILEYIKDKVQANVGFADRKIKIDEEFEIQIREAISLYKKSTFGFWVDEEKDSAMRAKMSTTGIVDIENFVDRTEDLLSIAEVAGEAMRYIPSTGSLSVGKKYISSLSSDFIFIKEHGIAIEEPFSIPKCLLSSVIRTGNAKFLASLDSFVIQYGAESFSYQIAEQPNESSFEVFSNIEFCPVNINDIGDGKVNIRIGDNNVFLPVFHYDPSWEEGGLQVALLEGLVFKFSSGALLYFYKKIN